MENIAEKKKAILNSTLALIKEHGFHGTPMSRVAQEAGVAAGTIYHYFESKDKLICELFSFVKSSIVGALFLEEDEVLDYKSHFFKMWTNLFRFYMDNPNVLVFFEQFVNSPYYTNQPKQEQDQFLPFYNFFKAGTQKGVMREVDPVILAVLMHGSILTTAKVAMIGKIVIGDREMKQITEILWEGMAPRNLA